MNIEVVKTKFPKGYEKVGKWMLDVIELQGGIDKKMRAEIPVDKIMQPMLLYNIRALYDFFDSYKIYISMDWHPKGFHSNMSGQFYGSRKEAEESAFEQGFEKLEKMLTIE